MLPYIPYGLALRISYEDKGGYRDQEEGRKERENLTYLAQGMIRYATTAYPLCYKC